MPKRNFFQCGFIDPLSLIGVGFLIVSIIAGGIVANNKGITLNPNKEAKEVEINAGKTTTTKTATAKPTTTPFCQQNVCIAECSAKGQLGSCEGNSCRCSDPPPKEEITPPKATNTPTPTPIPCQQNVCSAMCGSKGQVGVCENNDCKCSASPSPVPKIVAPTCITEGKTTTDNTLCCSGLTKTNCTYQGGHTFCTCNTNTCNADLLSYTGCGGGGCASTEVAQTWRTVSCEINTICKPVDDCKNAATGSYCDGGKINPNSSNYCKYGCIPDINGGKCKVTPITKKGIGNTCSNDEECLSGNCYSGSQTLGGSPFDTTKTCHAATIATMDTTVRDLNTNTAIGMTTELAVVAAAPALAEIGSLAIANGGTSALPSAIYSYGTASLTTLPASVQTALAVGGTVAGYAGVTAGTVACAQDPYSEACIAYVGVLQGDPMAMIQLGQSADNLIATAKGSTSFNSVKSLTKKIFNKVADNLSTNPFKSLLNSNALDKSISNSFSWADDFYLAPESINKNLANAIKTQYDLTDIRAISKQQIIAGETNVTVNNANKIIDELIRQGVPENEAITVVSTALTPDFPPYLYMANPADIAKTPDQVVMCEYTVCRHNSIISNTIAESRDLNTYSATMNFSNGTSHRVTAILEESGNYTFIDPTNNVTSSSLQELKDLWAESGRTITLLDLIKQMPGTNGQMGWDHINLIK